MVDGYQRLRGNVICGAQRMENLLAREAKLQKASSTHVLWCAVAFTTVMMLVEAVGGVMSGSLAVLCDAVHMLADVFTILISLFAAHASTWEANDRYSFAWRRAEVMGALVSVFTTWALVVWITISALARMPQVWLCAMDVKRTGCEVLETPLMMGLGCFGFAMNVLLTCLLFCGGVHAHSHGSLLGHQHEHSHAHAHSHGAHGHLCEMEDHCVERSDASVGQCDSPASIRGTLSVRVSREASADAPPQGSMNQRAALLHVFGDCLQAFGVVVAAGLTWVGNVRQHHVSSTAHSYFNLADPLLSLLFGIITVVTTTRLVHETWLILMECVPPTLSYAAFVDKILLEGAVSEILDLHIWMVGPNMSVLCATLNIAEALPPVEAQRLLERLTDRCVEAGVHHCTFQLEYSQHARM